jgi:hypothetical protein
MRRFLFVVPAVLAMWPLAAQAQTPLNVTWKCNVVQPMPTPLPVPGEADRVYAVYQAKCTTDAGEIAGVKQKEGTTTEFADMKPTGAMGHGVFVETLENGDTIAYKFQATSTTKNKIVQSATDTWTITGGTGKVKGIKGTGVCKGKGDAEGSITLLCTGNYTLPK